MKDELAILPESEPDATDVELLLAGAVHDVDARARIQSAMAGPLAAEADELRRFQDSWAAMERPPIFDQPAQARGAVVVPAPANRWRRGLALLAASAAVLIGVLLVPALKPDTGLRAMGALPVAAWVERGGREVAEPTPHLAGDRVFLGFSAPADGYALVGMVTAEGEPTLFWRAPELQALKGGAHFSLDGALELDDAVTQEWIVVMFTPEPQTPEQASAALAALRDDPVRMARARGWWAQEVTRGR